MCFANAMDGPMPMPDGGDGCDRSTEVLGLYTVLMFRRGAWAACSRRPWRQAVVRSSVFDPKELIRFNGVQWAYWGSWLLTRGKPIKEVGCFHKKSDTEKAYVAPDLTLLRSSSL